MAQRFTKGDHTDLVAALGTIKAEDFAGTEGGYSDWVKLGAAWKTAGLPYSAWDAWNAQDPEHYDAEGNREKWDGFSEDGSSAGKRAAAGSVARIIRDHGGSTPTYSGKGARAPKPEGQPATQKTADSKPEPPTDPVAQLLEAVTALFKDGEGVNVITSCKPKKNDPEKYDPIGHGRTYDAAELRKALAARVGKGDAGLEEVIGPYDHKAGVWWRANPTDGRGTKDANVTRLDHVLLESDTSEIPKMLETVDALGLPYDLVTFSGNHSAHVIVNVGAGTDRALYDERVGTLYTVAKANGIEVDTSCASPSKLSRLPGAERNGQPQKVLALGNGGTWGQWHDRLGDLLKPATTQQEDASGLPHVYDLAANWEDPPARPPVLIGDETRGLLRCGHKGLLTGASKSNKSWAALELAVAVATGGQWLGYTCKQGRVLYANFEIDGRSLVHRLKTVAKAYGLAPEQSDLVARNVCPLNLRGYSADTEQFTAHIIAEAQRMGNIGLVILDPLYMFSDADENSASETKQTMAALDRISRITGAATLTIHHHAKYASGSKAALDRGSGSGVFGRAPDMILDLSPLDVPEEDAHDLGGATAWRATPTCREFPPQEPFDVLYKWPLHYVDASGRCAAWELVGADPYASRDRAKRKKTEKAQDAHADLLWKAFKSCCEDGTAQQHGEVYGVTAGELWDHVGPDPTNGNQKPTRRSVENWAAQPWSRIGRENVSATARPSWVYFDTEAEG